VPKLPAPDPDKARKARRRMAKQVIIELRKCCPNAFTYSPVPLKIGVSRDVVALLADTYSRKVIRRALAFWTGRSVYLEAIARGGARYDLDGTIAGEVGEEHERRGRDELAERARRRRLSSETPPMGS
jgi:ProP effector